MFNLERTYFLTTLKGAVKELNEYHISASEKINKGP